MKKLTLAFVLLTLTIGASIAQETSKDNYFGNWTDNNSWVGGWSDGSPATLNLPESNADITIKGYIEVGTAPAPTPGSGDLLTFKGNKDAYDFIVNDTLVVYGDVNFANKSMNLVIGPGAVFIVMGNLSMNNKIDVASSGTLVVSGNFNKSGSQGSYTGSGDVYAGSFSGDAESTIDAGDGQSSFPIDQLSDDGFGPIENFVNNGGSSPLPITLVSFEIKEVNETVEISWVTSSEENNDYFTIERSVDGTHYEIMNKVNGAGNSNEIKQYTIVDKNPMTGQLYYRLSQTDFDGKSEVFDPKGIYIYIKSKRCHHNTKPG